jgi:hypothetical protein
MRHRVWRLAIIWATLIPSAAAANEIADLTAAAAAMSCCAATDYACAGPQTPDDCCQTMGHATTHSASATIAKAQLPASGVTAANLRAGTSPVGLATRRHVVSIDGKRPHDPPHLHTFSLLI